MSTSIPFKDRLLKPAHDWLFPKSLEALQVAGSSLEVSLRSYYTTLFFVICVFLSRVLQFILPYTHTWAWPLRWMRSFDDQRPAFFALVLASMLFAAWAALRPFDRRAKLPLAALVFLLVPAYYSSVGRPYHEFYLWMTTAWMLAPLRLTSDPDRLASNVFLFRASQTFVLFTYFLSGLSKAYEMVVGLCQGRPWADIFGAFSHSIASRLQAGGTPTFLSAPLMALPLGIQALLWVVAIAFEVTCFAVILRPRLIPLAGIAILFFHMLNGLVLGIPYTPSALLVAVILIAPRPPDLAPPRIDSPN